MIGVPIGFVSRTKLSDVVSRTNQEPILCAGEMYLSFSEFRLHVLPEVSSKFPDKLTVFRSPTTNWFLSPTTMTVGGEEGVVVRFTPASPYASLDVSPNSVAIPAPPELENKNVVKFCFASIQSCPQLVGIQ